MKTAESLKEEEIRVLKRIASSLAGIDTSLRVISKKLGSSTTVDVTEQNTVKKWFANGEDIYDD